MEACGTGQQFAFLKLHLTEIVGMAMAKAMVTHGDGDGDGNKMVMAMAIEIGYGDGNGVDGFDFTYFHSFFEEEISNKTFKGRSQWPKLARNSHRTNLMKNSPAREGHRDGDGDGGGDGNGTW